MLNFNADQVAVIDWIGDEQQLHLEIGGPVNVVTMLEIKMAPAHIQKVYDRLSEDDKKAAIDFVYWLAKKATV